MNRSEKLILVRGEPSDLVVALDAILAARGYRRAATRTISEDFSPLLNEAGEPLAFVFSAPSGEWCAGFTSLSFATEWEVAEELAVASRLPLVHAVFDAAYGVYGYRYFEDGELREEALPEGEDAPELDEDTLMQRLHEHGIATGLIDDRAIGFGHEHVVIAYVTSRQDEIAPEVISDDEG